MGALRAQPPTGIDLHTSVQYVIVRSSNLGSPMRHLSLAAHQSSNAAVIVICLYSYYELLLWSIISTGIGRNGLEAGGSGLSAGDSIENERRN